MPASWRRPRPREKDCLRAAYKWRRLLRWNQSARRSLGSIELGSKLRLCALLPLKLPPRQTMGLRAPLADHCCFAAAATAAQMYSEGAWHWPTRPDSRGSSRGDKLAEEFRSASRIQKIINAEAAITVRPCNHCSKLRRGTQIKLI